MGTGTFLFLKHIRISVPNGPPADDLRWGDLEYSPAKSGPLYVARVSLKKEGKTALVLPLS